MRLINGFSFDRYYNWMRLQMIFYRITLFIKCLDFRETLFRQRESYLPNWLSLVNFFLAEPNFLMQMQVGKWICWGLIIILNKITGFILEMGHNLSCLIILKYCCFSLRNSLPRTSQITDGHVNIITSLPEWASFIDN